MTKLNQTRAVDLQVVHRDIKLLQASLTRELPVLTQPISQQRANKICLPIKGGFALYHVDEISFCKAEGNYTEIHFKTEKFILISKTIKNIASCLPDALFIRCHQSYIVNKNHIRQYTVEGGLELDHQSESIPVSRRRRKELLHELSILSGLS